MKSKVSMLIVTVLLTLSLVAVGCAAPAEEAFHVDLATTNVESGNYPWAVGISEVMNKYVANVDCKTIALGGAGLTIPAVAKGEANFSTNITTYDMPEIYQGTGKWTELGKVDIRLLCMREFGYMAWYVTKGSGVTNVMDLKGKKVNQGSVGSIAEEQVKRIEAVLNIGADWTLGSTGTAKKDIKDRRIIGYIKSSPGTPIGDTYGFRFDASALDVGSMIPLTVVGFTEEQKDKILAADPSFAPFWSRVPAGGIKECPELGEMWLPTMSTSAMVVLSTVPQDVQYRIIKAIDERWQDTVAAAYPPCGIWDPIEDTIKFSAPPVPLAAGLVQYAKEKGIEVPAELIPPEYQD